MNPPMLFNFSLEFLICVFRSSGECTLRRLRLIQSELPNIAQNFRKEMIFGYHPLRQDVSFFYIMQGILMPFHIPQSVAQGQHRWYYLLLYLRHFAGWITEFYFPCFRGILLDLTVSSLKIFLRERHESMA